MIKRILAWILALALALLTAACAPVSPVEPSPESTAPTSPAVPAESERPAETEAPTQEATLAPASTEAPPSQGETEPPAAESQAPAVQEPVTEDFRYKSEQCDYSIPRLNYDTADARAVNEAIEAVFGAAAREGIQEEKDGLSSPCYLIDWEAHWYGSVLVLKVWRNLFNDSRSHEVYTYDTLGGRLLTNPEILRLCDVAEADFLAGAAASAEAAFLEVYGQEGSEDPFYQEQLHWSSSPENIRMDMVMFPSSQGKLMLLSPIGSLAGASSYERIYPYLP